MVSEYTELKKNSIPECGKTTERDKSNIFKDILYFETQKYLYNIIIYYNIITIHYNISSLDFNNRFI